ncbi:hypothetical protein [Mangrovimonas sp. ST2L15]|uniref:hypothetical protein n=1 Tax=Mangrovimonas sp. ST2L15 TaxID=1645916 RepID=UPI0006B4C488|nr:hypothetical protein [Mangrovimonas sp. ST2L15]
MKVKLKKFTEFNKQLLPNEARYLASKENFLDAEKKAIFDLLISNCLNQTGFEEFDDSINKRKYSYIKNWVERRIRAIDVDLTLEWLIDLKRKILTDAITADDEAEFLGYLTQYKSIEFNFQTLYDLAREYKPYLLVRMRYNDHQIVSRFLEEFKGAYEQSMQVKDKLYHATSAITDQYTLNNQETSHMESWLMDIFENETIDGKNRYQAFVLLAFMYTNYGENQKLEILFEKIDRFFSNGMMYSKRLLCNYYASRVLLHSKEGDFKKAEYFGYLSVRYENNDTLMYVNNLVAILLRAHKATEARRLLNKHVKLYQETHNYHQKIGYASYLIRTYIELGKADLAISTAEIFLKKYNEDILKHRWHHFFTSYVSALVSQEKYGEVLKVSSKYHLEERENERKLKNNYVPNIAWSISLSRFMEGKISSEVLLKEIKDPLVDIEATSNQKELMAKVIEKLSKNLPEAFEKLKSHVLFVSI